MGDGVKDRAELAAFPQHDARGQRDLGVTDVLGGQGLEEAARNQGVVIGRAEALSYGAESLQKGVEIGVGINRAALLDRRLGVELVQRLRFYGAFQVQMQLGFRQERGEIVHT